MARVPAFQAGCREFESRLPLHDFIWLGAVEFFLLIQNWFSNSSLNPYKSPVIIVVAISAFFIKCSYGSGVEHFLGKEEVEGSSPSMSSIKLIVNKLHIGERNG